MQGDVGRSFARDSVLAARRRFVLRTVSARDWFQCSGFPTFDFATICALGSEFTCTTSGLSHLGPDMALDLAKAFKEMVYLFVEFGGQPLQAEFT